MKIKLPKSIFIFMKKKYPFNNSFSLSSLFCSIKNFNLGFNFRKSFVVFLLFYSLSSIAQSGPNCPTLCYGPGGALTSGSLTISANTFYSSITVKSGEKLIVKSGFTLYVGNEGTSATTQVVDFQNGSTVLIEAGASLVVNGKLNNSNNSNSVTFNGSVSVTGNVTVGNGSTITGSGSLDSTGSVTGDGTIFGCSPNNYSPVIISNTAATCSTTGTSTISNYSSSKTYVFSPTGPTVGTGGIISGMTTGTTYTVTSKIGSCTSAASSLFSNAAMLPTPAIPTITSTAASCSSVGTSKISNYNVSNTYVFSPTGPTVGTGGALSGMTIGTSYTITSKIGSCTSLVSSSFSNGAMLPTPAAPSYTVIDITCTTSTGSIMLSDLPDGNWTVNPGGFTGTGSTFTISGLAAGSYSYSVTNANGCISALTGPLTIKDDSSTTWTGTGWSKGAPDNSKKMIFAGDYTLNAADSPLLNLVGCSCEVTSGTIVVPDGFTLTLTNDLKVSGGSLTFQNNASLVQINDAGENVNINSGSIMYKRHTAAVKRYDFTYWSSPVENERLINVSPTTLGDKFYSYDSVGNKWVIHYNGNMEMAVGEGYLIRAPQGFSITVPAIDTNPKFTGKPNNGVITKSLAAGKLYLLGNPYPSALDADEFLLHNKDKLEVTLYFWTHNSPPSNTVTGDAIYNYTSSDYASYNITGGNATEYGKSATTGGTKPTGKIAAGQGFFVYASSAGGKVEFKNGMRVSGNNTQFYRIISNSKTKNTIEKNRVWLNLTNKQGAFKQTLVGYITGATNGYDNGYDGVSFDGNAFIDFYSVNQGSKFAIQGRTLPFDQADTVPLGYRSTIVGDFTISIDQTDGLFDTQEVYIEDKLLNVVHNLKTAPYNFTTQKGAFNDRFVLSYANKTLATEDFEAVENKVVITNKNREVKISTPENEIDAVSIYDVSGRQIYSKSKVDKNELMITTLIARDQVLIVKVVMKDKSIVTKKTIY